MNSQPMSIEEHVIVESRLISINSRYATEYLNGLKNSSVVFDFNAIARKDAQTLYHTIAIQSAEIPSSFYNVNSTNNTIRIYEDDTGVENTISFTIPEGNYNADTFAAAFIVSFNAQAFSHNCEMVFNATTGKFSLRSDTVGVRLQLLIDETTAKELLGIPNNYVGVSAAGGTNVILFHYTIPPSFFPAPANFLGVTKIKVSSNALAGGNYDSISLNTSTLIDTISVSGVPFGLTIYNSLGRESFVKAKRIDEIDIQLHDQDDNTIDFNGANWNFTIIINTHRKQVFSNTDGIINFQKLKLFKESAEKPEPLKEELKELEVIDVKEIFDDSDDDILLS